MTAALALVALALLWRAGERSLSLGLVGGLAASAVVFAVGHRLLYGGWTPYATGSHFIAGETAVVGESPHLFGRARRLAGLLVDREFGLVPWAPAFLLVLPALGALVRRRPRWWLGVVAPLAAGWLVATFVALTMHGFWWPGRQVVLVLPLAVLAVLWWASDLRFARVLLVVLGLLGLITFAWLVVDGLAERITWVVGFATTDNPLYRVWRPLLPDGRSTATADLARTAVWCGVLAGAAVAGFLTSPTEKEQLR